MKILKPIIDNYYWIFVLLGVMSFFKFPDFYSYIALLTIVVTIISYNSRAFRLNAMDKLVLLFMVYQLLSFSFSNYPLAVYYYGIKGQVIPMFFYFIGRNMTFANNMFLEKMKSPIMVAMLFGLFLYFWSPSWYIEKRASSLAAESWNSSAYYEVTRLASFWSWSYTMGYASLFFIMYFFKKLFSNKTNLYNYFCLSVALLVLFFAQQRVTIAFLFVFLIVFSIIATEENKHRLKYIFAFILLTCIAIGIYLINYADKEFFEYVLKRSVQSEDNIVKERFNMYDSLLQISWLGEGLGKYGHAALEFKMRSITDCEYIRLMTELGIIGCFLFSIIWIKSGLDAFKHQRKYMFELFVLLFWAAAMIGATPMENYSMQPFLFWYCLGRIANKRLLRITPPQWVVDFINRVLAFISCRTIILARA